MPTCQNPKWQWTRPENLVVSNRRQSTSINSSPNNSTLTIVTPQSAQSEIVASRTQTEPRLGRGFYWQDLTLGQQMRTFRRTVTETDLVNFISTTGMLEVIFIDATYGGAIKGRPVPGALTYCLIEGFLMQNMVQGTGLAMLELKQQVLLPVLVGDSIEALVTITAVKPTSQHNRAVVDSRIQVFNQREEFVMNYEARRLIAGRPAAT